MKNFNCIKIGSLGSMIIISLIISLLVNITNYRRGCIGNSINTKMYRYTIIYIRIPNEIFNAGLFMLLALSLYCNRLAHRIPALYQFGSRILEIDKEDVNLRISLNNGCYSALLCYDN